MASKTPPLIGDRLPEHPLFRDLFARTTAGIRPGLAVIEDLLARLHHPEETVPALHVAGTNGKGSVCARSEAFLRAAGYRTFLYTSPHLIRYTERFRIDGEEVGAARLVEVIERVLAVDETAVMALENRRRATFFEITTAAAFVLAAECGADVALIETGLGGRWDATRPCQAVACAITRIGIDHTPFLGDDQQGIAREKAGIMRAGIPVAVAPQKQDVMAVLREEAAMVGAPLIELADEGKDFQAVNTQVACSLVNAWLKGLGKAPLSEDEVSRADALFHWPGRFQQVSSTPPMWLDGAHNLDAVQALIPSVQKVAGERNIGLLLGFLGDKDGEELAAAWAPHVARSWMVQTDHERGADEGALLKAGRVLNAEPGVYGLEMAWEKARAWAIEKKGIVIVCGSLYLIGEVLATEPWTGH